MNWLEETKLYKDAFIEDLRKLIAIPSLRNDEEACANAPFGKGCRAALDYMMELGRREGFTVKDIDGYACVLEYGEGDESVGVLGHLDVVPIGEGWTKDPFGGEIIDGYMFGRGTGDDKGPSMAGFYALKMLKDKQIPLNKKIMLIYGCDEESGMECMDYYEKHGEIPTFGFVPDASFPLVYGEKGIMKVTLEGTCDTVIRSMHAGERPNIVIGKANAFLKQWNKEYEDKFIYYLESHQMEGGINYLDDDVNVSMEGAFAHGAWPYKGVNAALHLLNYVGSAYKDRFAMDTYELLNDWMGKPLGIDFEGAYMGFLTMNTGIVDIEDGTVKITLDIRYPNEMTSEDIVQTIKEKLEERESSLHVSHVSDSKPLFVDPKSKLVTTLESVYREYTKDEFTPPMTMGGGTYARKLPNFVAYGPEFPNTVHDTDMEIGAAHQKDEAVKVDDLMMAIAIYAGALEALAKE